MAPGYRPVKVDQLPNGLRVLTYERHHAPTTCFMVWYGVGSRNERPGVTGISHFLEHMMFKGTERFPYGSLDEEIKVRGGMWNAFTYYDYTAYYEVLPSYHLDFALEMEADRMANMTIDPALTVRERGIIASERAGRENNPYLWLMDTFMPEAYKAMPYRTPVIGERADIMATTSEVLTEHYQRFYRPNNATLVVVGDFETERLLERVNHYFGGLSAGPDIPRLEVSEPAQTAERRCEIRRPGPNPYMVVGFKTVPGDHPDQMPLLLLGTLLSGAPSFGGGGGGMGRSSRLYRKLVNTGMVTWASAYAWTLQHLGLFLCSAAPLPGVENSRLEETLFAELEALRHELVTVEEMERAQKQVRTQFLYALEGVTGQARQIGTMAMAQGLDRYDHFLESLDRVTPADVQRVADQYLRPEHRTIGWFLPENVPGKELEPQAPPNRERESLDKTPAYQQEGKPRTAVPQVDQRKNAMQVERIVRRELPNGATLLIYPMDVPSVLVRVQMEAGAARDPVGKSGLAQMTAQMLLRGSERFTAESLALKVDETGLSIRTEAGRETSAITLKCLSDDLTSGMDILTDLLMHPTFPEEEFGRMRERMLVSVREDDDDTRARAGRMLAELLYPEEHPNRRPIDGMDEDLQQLTRVDLREFHRAHYRPAGAIICVIGNVDVDGITAMITGAFGDWQGGTGSQAIPATPVPVGGQHHVFVAGKTQVDIALGWPMVERTHPDYLALSVLATLLGGNGTPAQSRLHYNIRERHGLSYYQFSLYRPVMGPSTWSVHIGVQPDQVPLTIDLLKHELRQLSEEMIGESELLTLKSFLEDFPAILLEAAERVAIRLAELERFGLDFDELIRYSERVGRLRPEELREVAARHLTLDRLTIVTAGPDINV